MKIDFYLWYDHYIAKTVINGVEFTAESDEISCVCDDTEMFKLQAQERLQEKIKTLALANVLFGGRPFCVIECSDYEGGHFIDVAPYGYEPEAFEYIVFEGTPTEYAQQSPVFDEHEEPFHGEPKDTIVTAYELVNSFVRKGYKF